MADKEILQRFDKIPAGNQFVGTNRTGKQRVASSLLEINNDKGLILQIHRATSLPLEKERDRTRPRIDYIVLFTDMTNRASFQAIKDSVKYISIDYFLGRCCFVASKARNEALQNVMFHEVMSLADAYNSPLVCADLELEEEISLLAKKLLCCFEVACSFCNDVTPLFLDTTRQSFAFENS